MKKTVLILLVLAIPMIVLSINPFKTSGQRRFKPAVADIDSFDRPFPFPTSRKKPQKFFKSNQAIANQYIVVLKNPTGDAFGMAWGADSDAYQLAGTYRGNVKRVYSSAIRGFSTEMSAADAEALSQDDRVEFVEEDSLVSVESITLP